MVDLDAPGSPAALTAEADWVLKMVIVFSDGSTAVGYTVIWMVLVMSE